MANPEHLAILKQGVKAWNSWRQLQPAIRPDLSHSDLVGGLLLGFDLHNATLEHSDFTRAIIVRANLTNANIGGGNFRLANLSDARLVAANLINADFHKADLSGADLSSANLAGSILERTVLFEANFDCAIFGTTVFSNVDLSTPINLASAIHWAPSTIGINTIYRSKMNIPKHFLRGAGVPDDFLNLMKSLSTSGLEFQSCFMSYSTIDADFAEHLHGDLQGQGVRCWFAPHDIKGGRKLYEQIDEAIRVYDRLLLVLSDASMNSEWVKTEIANARQREIREGRQMLFPITVVPFEKMRVWEAFDADTGKDSAREVREYFIPDFSNWKDHDSYQAAFQRLLRDLKAEKDRR